MADTKISALTAASSALTTDLIPIARSGSNYYVTPAQLLNPTGSGFGVNATTGQVTIAAPTTGTSVTIGSVASQAALWLQGAAVSSANLQLSANTNAGTYYWISAKNSGVLHIGGNGATEPATGAIQITSAGNITIGAPTSGVALNITGASTSNVINVTTSAGATPLQFSDGTCTSWWFTNAANGAAVGTQTAHQFALYTGNSPRVTVSATGNISFGNASAGGPTVRLGTIGALAWYSSSAVQLNSSGIWSYDDGAGNIQIEIGNNYYQSVLGVYNRATAAASLIYRQTLTNGHIFQYAATGIAGSAITYSTAMQIGTSGNVTINAPSSGVALTANGVANGYTALFSGSSTSGQSYGVIIRAGTTSADICFVAQNQAASSLFSINGAGTVSLPAPTTTTGGFVIAPTAYANRPTTPTPGMMMVINDSGAVTYGGAAAAGGSIVALIMWNGSSWVYA